MPIYMGNRKVKLYLGNKAIKAMYLGNKKVYSSGNTVTYRVDSGVTYTEEVDEGASCLSPKSFTPTKSGWNFVGWRTDSTANGTVLTNKVMGDEPITLYAVFTQSITLSTVANGVASNQSKNRVYNNSNIANPVFTVSNPSKSGAMFKGWSSAANSMAISNSSISNLSLSASTTRYAIFKYTDTSASVASRTISIGWKPYQGTTEETTTLYTLDTSKYESLTVTASVGQGNISNATTGEAVVWIYMCGTVVRMLVCYSGQTTTSDYPGTSSYPGYGGKTFTLTYAGNLTFKWKTQGTNHVTDFQLTISSVTLNGKTVVG